MATEAKGHFEDEVVSDYLKKEGKQYSKNTVDYWVWPSDLRKVLPASLVKTSQDAAVNTSLYNHEVVYMDVGAWIGNGDKSEKNHQRHREFGVVCGSVAALCAFTGGKSGGDIAPSRNLVRDLSTPVGLNTYEFTIKPFLTYLASPLEQPTLPSKEADHLPPLGDVEVLGAMEATQLNGSTPDTDTLHVFLGDLHLPIISDPHHPTLVGDERSKVRVAAGRLDPTPEKIERLQKAFAKYESTSEVLALDFVASPVAAAAWTPAALALYNEAGEDLWKFVSAFWFDHWDSQTTDGFMTREDAARWAQLYVGTDQKKGADVFQDSGSELVAFLRRLQRWKKRNGKRIHLVQTGDLFDFWIGLKRAFEPADGKGADINAPIHFPTQLDGFIEFWMKETSSNHRSGGVVREFTKMLQGDFPDLQVTILRGNHDDYMLRSHGGFSTSTQFRSKSGSILAEHGHQSDSFNSDQDADKGWALTQAAFFVPPVRDIEDPASVALTKVKRAGGASDPGARLQRVARGAEEGLARGAAIYVMGHTHESLLRKVIVRPISKFAEVRAATLKRLSVDARRLSDEHERAEKTLQKLRSQRAELLKDHQDQFFRRKELDVLIEMAALRTSVLALRNRVHVGTTQAVESKAVEEAAAGADSGLDAARDAGRNAPGAVIDAEKQSLANTRDAAVATARWSKDAAVATGVAVKEGAVTSWNNTRDAAVTTARWSRDAAVATGVAVKEGAQTAWQETTSAADAAANAAAEAWHASVAAAERCLEQAERAIEAAARAGWRTARKEVDDARQELAEARRELDGLVARGSAAARPHVVAVRNGIENMEKGLEKIEQMGVAWAEKRVAELEQEAQELIRGMRSYGTFLADELRSGKNELERWAKRDWDNLKADLAGAQRTVKSVAAWCAAWLKENP